jgi:hypothetical protein
MAPIGSTVAILAIDDFLASALAVVLGVKDAGTLVVGRVAVGDVDAVGAAQVIAVAARISARIDVGEPM